MKSNSKLEKNDSKELKFTSEVSNKIKSYVYRLIDPRVEGRCAGKVINVGVDVE